MLVKIEVLQSDIDSGRPDDCGFCPVALAIKRAANVKTIHVSLATVVIYFTKSSLCRIKLPAEANEFIDKFDAEKEVEPFSFDLEIPDQFVLSK